MKNDKTTVSCLNTYVGTFQQEVTVIFKMASHESGRPNRIRSQNLHVAVVMKQAHSLWDVKVTMPKAVLGILMMVFIIESIAYLCQL